MRINTHQEMSAALKSSTYCFFEFGDKILWRFSDEKNHIGEVCVIEALMRKLITTKNILLKIKIRKLSRQREIDATDVGKNFLKILNINKNEIKKSFPTHEFSPVVELFFSATSNHQELFPKWKGSCLPSQIDLFINSLNSSINLIRKEGNSKDFKYKRENFTRLSNKNFRGLNSRIDYLFEKYRRFLVVRIDFGYLKGENFLTSKPTEINFSDVRKHRLMLGRYINEKLPTKSIIGFAWKLQYSLNISYQYSYILFSRLDIDGGGDSELITNLIGSYWDRVITNGRGLHYSGEKFGSGYKKFGTGIADCTDALTRKELNKAAFYLTKQDEYIKLLVSENGRSFQNSQFH